MGNPRVSSSIKAAIVLYPDIDLLAEEKWLSENPACVGRFSNPNRLLRQPRSTSAARSSRFLPWPRLLTPSLTSGPASNYRSSLSPKAKTTARCPTKDSVEFYDALVKVANESTAQLIIEQGEGHYPNFNYPNFNYNELEAPATKLLRAHHRSRLVSGWLKRSTASIQTRPDEHRG